MGNSRWRLETCLNYLAARVAEVGRSNEVEVLVADWGSDVPLGQVVTLTPTAARLVSFVHVPPSVAEPLQGESPFPEVLALNVALRRARGRYIGRIDQDTLVGARFLRTFFGWQAGTRPDLDWDAASLLYANRRSIPYRFSVRCPSLGSVERLVRLWGSRLAVWRRPNQPFWTYWVGIWLMHRDVWFACGAYDERLIFYNWMETDMVLRLKSSHPLVDLGAAVDYDFYHLEHQRPGDEAPRHMRKNKAIDLSSTPAFHPNSGAWGLRDTTLPVERTLSSGRPRRRSPGVTEVGFWLLLMSVAVQMAVDRASDLAAASRRRWGHRAASAWNGVRTESLWRWPAVLLNLWTSRSARLFAGRSGADRR